MSLKIDNETVIDNSIDGDFNFFNPGAYTKSQLYSNSVTGSEVGDFVYCIDTSSMAYWTGSSWEIKNDYTTRGLIANLDASISASYPGSGSTWFDLSPTGDDATLIGSPSYTSSPGYFNMTSDNTYARLGSYDIGSGDVTYSMWVSFNEFRSYNVLFENCNRDDNGADRAMVRIETGTRFQLEYTDISVYIGQEGNPIGKTSWPDRAINTWYNIVWSRRYGDNRLYVNGVEMGGFYSNEVHDAKDSLFTFLMRQQGTPDTDTSTNGKISQFAVYNRALSDREVFHNYEVLKRKYGY